jgi:hypothetical protein
VKEVAVKTCDDRRNGHDSLNLNTNAHHVPPFCFDVDFTANYSPTALLTHSFIAFHSNKWMGEISSTAKEIFIRSDQ